MVVEHAFIRRLATFCSVLPVKKRMFTILAGEYSLLPTPQGVKCDRLV